MKVAFTRDNSALGPNTSVALGYSLGTRYAEAIEVPVELKALPNRQGAGRVREPGRGVMANDMNWELVA